MPHPLLLEINTRCWLRALSDKSARTVTLATVPPEQFASWKKRGFSHVWLMGSWTSGPKAAEQARAQPGLRALSVEAFGPQGPENLAASPYAVADYTVAESLGGPAGLRKFRASLRRHGLGLILDFVPNHLGVDHPWVTQKTSLFVQDAGQRPETFPVSTNAGVRWVAHGKDPNFPAWTDTAQLDYRLPATRAAMTDLLQSIAAQCDGVRCDMAMLLLNDIMDRTWGRFPPPVPAAPGEFWAGAISAVKQKHPRFLFIAEAYWDTEPRLQSLGFDHAYDKRFYDCLTRRDYPALQECVRAGAGRFQPVRFLENHDEPRIASLFSVPEQKAAAVLLLAQPGMRLLYDGQESGIRRRAPVQFARAWPESPNPEITAFYDQLLTLLPRTAIGNGEMEFCETGLPHCFALKWKNETRRPALATVNLSSQPATFQISHTAGPIACLFSDAASRWEHKDTTLSLTLAPCGWQLFAQE